MSDPRRDKALREQGEVGTSKSKLSYQHSPFRAFKQAAINQPSNGALGDAFYSKLFGKAVKL